MISTSNAHRGRSSRIYDFYRRSGAGTCSSRPARSISGEASAGRRISGDPATGRIFLAGIIACRSISGYFSTRITTSTINIIAPTLGTGDDPGTNPSYAGQGAPRTVDYGRPVSVRGGTQHQPREHAQAEGVRCDEPSFAQRLLWRMTRGADHCSE